MLNANCTLVVNQYLPNEEKILAFKVNVSFNIEPKLDYAYLNLVVMNNPKIVDLNVEKNPKYPITDISVLTYYIENALSTMTGQKIYGSNFEMGYRLRPMLTAIDKAFVFYDDRDR